MIDGEDARGPAQTGQPSEAEAQREETVMPWLWGGVGLLVIAAFVTWVLVGVPAGHIIRNPPAAAPAVRAPGQSY